MESTVFWYVMPCSLVEVYRHFGAMFCFHLHGRRISQASSIAQLSAFFLLVVCLTYFLSLKMETARSSETSVHLYKTTQRHFPEDTTFLICINTIGQSASQATNRHTAFQEIRCPLLEPWGSLPCSQQPVTGAHTMADEFSPHYHTPFQ
jgi:hypothetical protein